MISSLTSTNSSNSLTTNNPLNRQSQQSITASTISAENERTSEQIQLEIQRFESVHPCIYTVYDLIDNISDIQLQEQLREQVVCIEDAFVNSQEWTLSRMVNELKLGVVGSMDSGKTSLVHFYLTGNCTTDESPEGGRFKKEVLVDNKSYLLLIRDEGSIAPEAQFTNWIDGVILVFAVESRESYQIALQYFKRMASYRNFNDFPIFLVGTQMNPNFQREVSNDEAFEACKARKICNYIECCVNRGLNVELIFNTACQKVLQYKKQQNLFNNNNCINRNSTSTVPVYNLQDYSSNRSNYHHQRSISALPSQDQQQQQQIYQQPNLRNSSTNQTILRRSQQQPYQQHSTTTTTTNTSNLVYNGAAIQQQQQQLQGSTNSVSTFYQASSPENYFHRGSLTSTTTAPTIPEYSNNFGRTSDRSCSTFLMPSNINNVSVGGGTMNNRISHPDFSSMSLAYSHTNLASQYTPQSNNQILPQYSRSSSNVLGSAGGIHLEPYYLQNDLLLNDNQQQQQQNVSSSSNTLINNNNNHHHSNSFNHASTSHLQSPSNTPNTQRKNRRISNIFRQNKDHNNHNSNNNNNNHHHHHNHNHHHNHQTPEERIAKTSAEINMGVGRAIPIKQGLLYKRSNKALNKEWKKKYVCLYSDGRLSYHQNLKEYMDKDSRGKEVYLGLATVRVSGRQRPRATNRNSMLPQQISSSISASTTSMSQSLKENGTTTNIINERDSLKSPIIETNIEGGCTSGTSDGGGGGGGGGGTGNIATGSDVPGSGGLITSTTSSTVNMNTGKDSKHNSKPSTAPSIKKKRTHRRLGGGTAKNQDDEEDCDFEIISCNQKSWEFSAANVEERDEWVGLIEEQIEKCLQGQLSQKQQQNSRLHAERSEVQALRLIAGNDACADCGSIKPDWASLNLGTLICIECSGIHRNLGSHISRVRSIDLDDWPIEYLNVMESMGNTFSNRIWEHNAPKEKPTADSNREQKENWIKLKYEQRLFLPSLPVNKTLGQQVINAVLARDLSALMIVLPRCTEKDVNSTISLQDRRTPIHLACSNGAPEVLQLLIWYNASPRALDEMGRSALWHARHNGSKECAQILLNTGLPSDYGLNPIITTTTTTTTSNNSTTIITGNDLANTTTTDYLTKSTFNPQSVLINGNSAKFRKQSDFMEIANNGFKPQKQQQQQQQLNKANTVNEAFQCLPASII